VALKEAGGELARIGCPEVPIHVLAAVQGWRFRIGENNKSVNRSVGIHPTSSGDYGKSGRASNHVTKESNERESEHAEIRPLKEVERQAILVAVKRLGVHGAAAVLGIGKTTIHRKLRDYQQHEAEPEWAWRAVPLTKVNELLTPAAKATEFLKWCQGTMAPRLGQQLDAAVEDFRKVCMTSPRQSKQSVAVRRRKTA
jgi:hypothetical protein